MYVHACGWMYMVLGFLSGITLSEKNIFFVYVCASLMNGWKYINRRINTVNVLNIVSRFSVSICLLERSLAVDPSSFRFGFSTVCLPDFVCLSVTFFPH